MRLDRDAMQCDAARGDDFGAEGSQVGCSVVLEIGHPLEMYVRLSGKDDR